MPTITESKISIKRKILIIENQKIQFQDIYSTLKNKYEIIPHENDFVTHMDYIRVWANTQYEEEYREQAFNYLKKKIIDKDLIIMDYIIGGAHHCKTGIDLANELLEFNNKLNFLFFSKIPENDRKKNLAFEKLKFNYNHITDKNWLNKGYFNFDLFQNDGNDEENKYLTEVLVNRIDLVIGKNIDDELMELLEKWINESSDGGVYEKTNTKLIQIKTNTDITYENKKMIIQYLTDAKNLNDIDIEKLNY